MKVIKKKNLPSHQVVAYTKKGISFVGYLRIDSDTGIVSCENRKVVLSGIVAYEEIADSGKRITQFLVSKGILKDKRKALGQL